MVERAKDRADTGKKTEFEFGGKRWTLEQAATSATRSKKALLDGKCSTQDPQATLTDNRGKDSRRRGSENTLK
jgi:hypothetical protein